MAKIGQMNHMPLSIHSLQCMASSGVVRSDESCNTVSLKDKVGGRSNVPSEVKLYQCLGLSEVRTIHSVDIFV